MRFFQGRGRLVLLAIVAIGLLYLSFINIASSFNGTPRSSTPWGAANANKKNGKNGSAGSPPADSSDISQPAVASKPKSPLANNVQMGEPLFGPPNTPFDRAVEALKNQSNSNARDGDDVSKRFDKFAVALKTGAEVAVERASIHLVTFLKKIKNLVIIGESPGVHIGDHPMVDVYTGVYDLVDKRLSAKKEKDDSEKQKLNQKNSTPKDGAAADDDEADAKPPKRNRRLVPRKEAAVVPAEDSRGWKLDAHKNIPGYEYMYRKFPNADWYIMIDDDSYVFFDNLERYLRNKNPEEPHYIGQSNVFVGCDGVQKFGDGPYFAHGGSGIVVSRGAVKKMMGNIENCIKKYKDCWAGDVRLALCLRDVGILLEGGQYFEKEPPNDDSWFPEDGCARPNVFHHLLPHQVQRLHEIESMALAHHPERGATWADVLQFFNPNRPSIEQDTDRPGKDYDNKRTADAKACEELCQSDKKCKSWAFDGAKCWLKSAIASIKRDNTKGKASGILPERYVCKA
ncbi:hypothetical protein HDU96_002449 [Phlyctochytrium bullatum]|nr:hypothetical protein HDU96_002449 [Phlyctochytrium bullatum]